MRPIALLIWVIVIAPLVWRLYREHTGRGQESDSIPPLHLLERGQSVIADAVSDPETPQRPSAATPQAYRHTHRVHVNRSAQKRYTRLSSRKAPVRLALLRQGHRVRRYRRQPHRRFGAHRSARKQILQTPSSAAHTRQSCGRNKRPSTGFYCSRRQPKYRRASR